MASLGHKVLTLVNHFTHITLPFMACSELKSMFDPNDKLTMQPAITCISLDSVSNKLILHCILWCLWYWCGGKLFRFNTSVCYCFQTLYAMERLHAITGRAIDTPHELWFHETYGAMLEAALERLRHPPNPRNPHSSWSGFKQVRYWCRCTIAWH